VEGFFDCFQLHQVGVAAVALMGAAFSEAQQRALLQSFHSVILMLDGDEAGRRATDTVVARLRPYASVRVIRLPDSLQPDQLSAVQIRQILQTLDGPATPGRLC
jgi:DNA primase